MSDTAAKVREILFKVLGQVGDFPHERAEDIPDSAFLKADLQADSLDLVEIQMDLEAECDLPYDDQVLSDALSSDNPTVAELIAAVDQSRQRAER